MIRKEHIFQLLVKQQAISEEWGSLDSWSKVQSTSEIDDLNMKVLVGLQNLAFFNGQLFENSVFFSSPNNASHFKLESFPELRLGVTGFRLRGFFLEKLLWKFLHWVLAHNAFLVWIGDCKRRSWLKVPHKLNGRISPL